MTFRHPGTACGAINSLASPRKGPQRARAGWLDPQRAEKGPLNALNGKDEKVPVAPRKKLFACVRGLAVEGWFFASFALGDSRDTGGTCEDTGLSSNSTIHHLPSEVLLEVFDSYRRGIHPHSYDYKWREQFGWFNLAHVCRKWRAVMFASAYRLDLSIFVGPKKPGHIERILLGPFLILLDYKRMFEDITLCALWRMHSALEYHDRVREISFGGTSDWFDEFFGATNCPFPELESLVLVWIRRGNGDPRYISWGTRLIGSASSTTYPLDSPSHPPTPKDIIPLPKLTRFSYVGPSIFLDALVAGLSAPSLRGVNIKFVDAIWPPIVHLPAFLELDLCLSLQTNLNPSATAIRVSNWACQCGGTPVTFDTTADEDDIPWRKFYHQFPSVKMLRTEGAKSIYCIARTLHQNHEEPDNLTFFPALEEIDLGKKPFYNSRRRPQLAAFEPFVSARQQAGRPVKVFFRP
ncbi:hypothetical protein BJV77DRAFT_960841 [Russula vinacea]|nr:hypothetical protein BJV77DRAFT_960841 [Russula vinacea]